MALELLETPSPGRSGWAACRVSLPLSEDCPGHLLRLGHKASLDTETSVALRLG